MGQALYRKYRPKNLAEIAGQEPITRALDRAIKSDNVSHAYLFTGPRGVGKTSIARILAHEVNKLPYDEAATNLDIIEIDAASNRRIDEIRDLRDKVHVAPSSATYKVYIVDEVHMLTKEAFNALLKTLEEPPKHVIFILATTEVHKLPETIISRTQHFSFKPIVPEQIIKHLDYIAKQEKIDISGDALQLIAEHSRGSFRDSISLLDQIRNYGDTITAIDVESILGIAPHALIEAVIAAIHSGNAAAVVEQLQRLAGQGVNATTASKQIGEHLRAALITGNSTLSNQTSIALQQKLLLIPTSFEPLIALELCLLEFTLPNNAPQPSVPVALTTAETPKKPEVKAASVHIPKKSEPVPVSPKKVTPEPVTTKSAEPPKLETAETVSADTTPTSVTDFDIARWQDVLTHIKQQYNTMYGMLRMAEVSLDDNELTLRFKFAFHQKKINDPKSKKIIIDAITQLGCSAVAVTCLVAQEETTGVVDGKTEPIQDLGTISNIFGGAELLES